MLIREYLESGSISEARGAVEALLEAGSGRAGEGDRRLLLRHLVRKAVTIALDHDNRAKELVAQLLSALHPLVIDRCARLPPSPPASLSAATATAARVSPPASSSLPNSLLRCIMSGASQCSRCPATGSLTDGWADELGCRGNVKDGLMDLCLLVDDLKLDIVDAPDEVAVFVARAMVDDMLAPADLHDISRSLKGAAPVWRSPALHPPH